MLPACQVGFSKAPATTGRTPASVSAAMMGGVGGESKHAQGFKVANKYFHPKVGLRLLPL